MKLPGLRRQEPPALRDGAAVQRDALVAAGLPTERTLGFGPLSIGDDWTPAEPFRLWHATKLTALVMANPVLVRFSRSQPPAPPVWDAPAPIAVGPYGHAGPFGYFQFRNAIRGAAATVQGAAFAE